MAGRVAGKVALITGAASGLGKADALRLAEEGAKLILTDVNVDGGQAVAREIGKDAIFLEHDVSNEDQWQSVIKQGLDKFGKLHVVVNNAGIVISKNIETTTTEEWRRAHAIMTDGVFFGCKYGVMAIKEHGEPSSIINVSSTAAFLGYPIFLAYAACKGAVRSMTKSVAIHCQQSGYKIRCNSIHPGGIDTPMIRNAAQQAGAPTTPPPEPPAGMPPGPGIGEPVDVANTVLFLASDESKFINGAEILIDNGTIIQP